MKFTEKELRLILAELGWGRWSRDPSVIAVQEKLSAMLEAPNKPNEDSRDRALLRRILKDDGTYCSLGPELRKAVQEVLR